MAVPRRELYTFKIQHFMVHGREAHAHVDPLKYLREGAKLLVWCSW